MSNCFLLSTLLVEMLFFMPLLFRSSTPVNTYKLSRNAVEGLITIFLLLSNSHRFINFLWRDSICSHPSIHHHSQKGSHIVSCLPVDFSDIFISSSITKSESILAVKLSNITLPVSLCLFKVTQPHRDFRHFLTCFVIQASMTRPLPSRTTLSYY